MEATEPGNRENLNPPKEPPCAQTHWVDGEVRMAMKCLCPSSAALCLSTLTRCERYRLEDASKNRS